MPDFNEGDLVRAFRKLNNRYTYCEARLKRDEKGSLYLRAPGASTYIYPGWEAELEGWQFAVLERA